MTDEKTETVIEIDRERALQLLEEAVAERGADYKYTPTLKDETAEVPGCFYARDGAPSCGVGLAMFKAGVPIEELEKWDEDGGGYIADIFNSYLFRSNVDVSLEAIRVFAAFQMKQDNEFPWGEALAYARTAATAEELA